MSKTNGVRIAPYNNELLPPGGYAQSPDGIWHCRAPVPKRYFGGNLEKHTVEEHPDGTITVTPSILITHHLGTWHGHLRKGVWEMLSDSKLPPITADTEADHPDHE